jgi:tetratricopeptide (TPR) repeat protein
MHRPVLGLVLALACAALPARADEAEKLCAAAFEPAKIVSACTAVIEESVLRPSARAKGYAARGWARMRQDDHPGARADFDAALKLDGDNISALLGRGTVDGGDNKLDSALADFAQAQKLEPRNQGVFLNRAQVLINHHRYSEALADAEFDRYAPGASNTFLNLRCRARAYGGIDLDQARLVCNQALWLQPNLPVLLEARGIVALKQKRAEAALADFTSLSNVQSQAARGWYGKALAEQALGREAEAKADFAKARGINAKVDTMFADMGLGQS